MKIQKDFHLTPLKEKVKKPMNKDMNETIDVDIVIKQKPLPSISISKFENQESAVSIAMKIFLSELL